MRNLKHAYLMVALVVVGAAVFLSGVGGGVVFLLWPLACAGMMVTMTWGMRGMGKPTERVRPDGVRHFNDDVGMTQLLLVAFAIPPLILLAAGPALADTAPTGGEFGCHVSTHAQTSGFGPGINPGQHHRGFSGWDGGMPC